MNWRFQGSSGIGCWTVLVDLVDQVVLQLGHSGWQTVGSAVWWAVGQGDDWQTASLPLHLPGSRVVCLVVARRTRARAVDHNYKQACLQTGGVKHGCDAVWMFWVGKTTVKMVKWN